MVEGLREAGQGPRPCSKPRTAPPSKVAGSWIPLRYFCCSTQTQTCTFPNSAGRFNSEYEQMPHGLGDTLRPIACAKFSFRLLEMTAHRLGAETEQARNFAHSLAVCRMAQHGQLPRSQIDARSDTLGIVSNQRLQPHGCRACGHIQQATRKLHESAGKNLG